MSWVAERLGVRIEGDEVAQLVGLALRRNPRRAHLLVSRVLGKHVPTDPRLVRAAGLALGLRVAQLLDGVAHPRVDLGPALAQEPDAAVRARDEALAGVRRTPGVTVLGYAETATALGHLVAEALDAEYYLHSTRRPVAGVTPFGAFTEDHSHATDHLLLPAAPAALTGAAALVLVDDELSTGRTVANTLRALHARAPRAHYVVATLVDVRGPADHAVLRALGDELGARIDVIALAAGQVHTPDDVLAAGSALVAALASPDPVPVIRGSVRRIDLGWPAGVPDGARHGVTRTDRATLEAALPGMAARLGAELPGPAAVVVLGHEELMHAPLRLAEALADLRPDLAVRSCATTRSPVLALNPDSDADADADADGYAIRHRLEFRAHDRAPDGPRYAYNLEPGRYDAVVLVIDDVADTPELKTLLDALSGVTATVVVAVIPSARPTAAPAPLRGPGFGSYAPDEVTWLLTDLSHVALEAGVAEREQAVQSGAAHYAETLPVEYRPEPAYLAQFHEALGRTASRLAHAVGVVAEILLAERGPQLVLASLARAGTPVGILLRRWVMHAHGVALPHYAVSIVRGRGIDEAALEYLAAHHDPSSVVFVDGWTGKGAIAAELRTAVAAHHARTGHRFSDALAVLADPGYCVRTFGTRADYLIPSACLNSTVSGLVSRTVLNTWDLAPGAFHGGKFYTELADDDVSPLFLDTVTARFDDVAAEVARDWPVVAAGDREPTWSGWRAVEEISERYGIGSTNLVKPGVGETTRVLLRRVPWRVLVRPDARAELGHVLLLAAQRGVQVEEVDGLAYSCVGLIHPNYRR